MLTSVHKALFVFTVGALVWLSAVAGFNIKVDPFCLRCDQLDLRKSTLNPYYRVAQNLASYPETQQIVLGTSRGMVFPNDWFESKNGLKTISVATAGSEVFAKIAFIRMAQALTHLSSVVWVMDYFEFVEGIRNKKFLSCPYVHHYIENDLPTSFISSLIQRIGFEIDHNTLEASFVFLKNPPPFIPTKAGGPNTRDCPPRPREGIPEGLLTSLEATYSTYGDTAFVQPIAPYIWTAFSREMKRLTQNRIKVFLLVPPYHPLFRQRFQRNHPESYTMHEAWVKRLEGLQNPNLRVVSFLSGLPDDHPGPQNWKDGDHFTCQAAVSMLEVSGFH